MTAAWLPRCVSPPPRQLPSVGLWQRSSCPSARCTSSGAMTGRARGGRARVGVPGWAGPWEKRAASQHARPLPCSRASHVSFVAVARVTFPSQGRHLVAPSEMSPRLGDPILQDSLSKTVDIARGCVGRRFIRMSVLLVGWSVGRGSSLTRASTSLPFGAIVGLVHSSASPASGRRDLQHNHANPRTWFDYMAQLASERQSDRIAKTCVLTASPK